jgi:hypothetical protein
MAGRGGCGGEAAAALQPRLQIGQDRGRTLHPVLDEQTLLAGASAFSLAMHARNALSTCASKTAGS